MIIDAPIAGALLRTNGVRTRTLGNNHDVVQLNIEREQAETQVILCHW